MTAKTIRWGIIGVGDVTEVKSGPGFQKAEHSTLVAVMRRDAEKAEDFARRHGVPHWYSDAEALINDAEVDAVYIATPPHVHHELTRLVAQAGKPVFVEKPMALNLSECEGMVEACRQADVPLWVAYYRRCLPRFVKIKELLDSGAIGEVRTVSVTLHRRPLRVVGDELPWRVQPEIAGGGLFMDVGVHMLDLLDYFLGPIGQVSGFAVNQAGLYPAEDNVVGSFRFESGATGVGTWCFNSDEERDEALITGSAGTISYSTFADAPIWLNNHEGVQEFEIPHPPHVHQPLIQSIVDEMLGRGTCPSTGESATRTARVTDTLLAGYGGEVSRRKAFEAEDISEYFEAHSETYQRILSTWLSSYRTSGVILDIVHEIRQGLLNIELGVKSISGSPYAEKINLDHLDPQLSINLTNITKHIELIRMLLASAIKYAQSLDSHDDNAETQQT